jgi:hypothetical protein
MDTKAETLADDLLNGAPAIAEEIREPLHRTYRLLEGGHIPGFKLMGKWTSTRSALRAAYSKHLTSGETA